MIVGFCGNAGSGKDTSADVLVKHEGFVKVALADPMKRIAQEVFEFSDEQLWGPSDKRNEPDERYVRVPSGVGYDPVSGRPSLVAAEYLTPRLALQKLGTEWGRNCYEDVWVDYALRVHARLQSGFCYYDAKSGLRHMFSATGAMVAPKKNVVISDVRFRNEIDAIRRAGGRVVRLLRGTGLEGDAGKHQSETEMKKIPDSAFDAVIDNSKLSLKELEERVLQTVRSFWR